MALAKIAYLHVEDLTVFICRRNRFCPKRNRRLDDISRGECYNWFGQNHTNMCLLILHLRIPLTFTTPTGVVYTGEECFLIYLYHAIKGSPFTEMARFVFGGGSSPPVRSKYSIHQSRVQYIFSIKYLELAWNEGCQEILICAGS